MLGGAVLRLVLPHLVAGRDLADLMIDGLDPLKGDTLVVDAGRTGSGSASFASQLVRRVLLEEHAERLEVVGAPPRFAEHVLAAARALGLEQKVSVGETAAAG